MSVFNISRNTEPTDDSKPVTGDEPKSEGDTKPEEPTTAKS